VERALAVGAHAGHLAALTHDLDDVGVEVQIDSILPGPFGVGIGQPERAHLVIAQKLQRTLRIVTDARLRLAQGRLVEPAHLIGQMRDIGDNMLGIEPVFIVINHVLEPGALELEIHPVVFQQFLVQAGVQGIGLQGKVEKTRWQDMRGTGVDNHGRTLGFTLAFGRHHAKKNHPAAQPHGLADGPQPACRRAAGIAGALAVDQGYFKILAPGQVIRTGGANNTATGDDNVIGLDHVRHPCSR